MPSVMQQSRVAAESQSRLVLMQNKCRERRFLARESVWFVTKAFEDDANINGVNVGAACVEKEGKEEGLRTDSLQL
jgi:hypothetical protein